MVRPEDPRSEGRPFASSQAIYPGYFETLGIRDAVIVQERLIATLATTLATFFSGLALLLTAVGLHGLLTFLVVQRTRELAVRMALGAPRAGIVRMVAQEALILVGAGATIAIPLAFMLGRLSEQWLSGLLFGLAPDDGATLVGAASVLAVIGVVAAALPARRASSVDPLVALRSE